MQPTKREDTDRAGRLGRLLPSPRCCCSCIFVLSRAGVRRPGAYIGLIIGVWLAVFTSAVHATVAGVGFTMSLFISELAFSDHQLVSEAKVGILVASLLAGVCGFVALQRTLPREAAEGG